MQSVPVEGLKNKKGETFTHHVNEYFVAHPEMVMGQHTATGKMREANQYNVEPTGDLATQLQEAIQRLPKNAIDLNPKGQTLQAFQDALPAPGTRPFEFVLHEDRIGQVMDGKVTPVELSDADEARLRAILPIRDAIRAVYDLLADPESSDTLVTAAQTKLEKLYDAFKDKFGYLSEDKNWKAFREDPDFPLLLSLEDYDTERETAKKTAIFTTKARLAEQAARTADTPELALQLMLGERGRIDLDRAGELLGVSPDDAAAQLAAKGLILDTPSGWALPAQYLSGNVRVKLAEAEAAAKLDPRYAPAVEALKSVIPPDIPSFKINTRLGAPWVPADIVTQFIAHIVNSSPNALEWTITVNPYNAKWHIEGPPRAHVSQFATPDVGTKAWSRPR
jgi:DNA methylase